MVLASQRSRVPILICLLLILVAKGDDEAPQEWSTVPSDGFTLVDWEGNKAGSGKLGLLLYDGGRVCDLGWDKDEDDDWRTHNELNAVCKALGFKMGVWEGRGDSDYEFKKKYDYSIYETRCSSADWSDCTVSQKGNDDCDEYTDIFIICSNGEEGKPLVEEFSLVNENGKAAAEGELGQLRFKGNPVSEVDALGAHVACKMMGFDGVTRLSMDDPQFKQLITDEENTPNILRQLECDSDDWFSCKMEIANNKFAEKVTLACGAYNPVKSDCPVGTYLDLRVEDPKISVCVICPGGYSAGGATKECTRCPRNYQTKAPAASKEDCVIGSCPGGTYLDKEENKCIKCKAGTYRQGWISRYEEEKKCDPCPEGKTVAEGEGKYKSACEWSGPCKAGQYMDYFEGCKDCWADYWSPADNMLNFCIQCPWGTYVPAGKGTKQSDCQKSN